MILNIRHLYKATRYIYMMYIFIYILIQNLDYDVKEYLINLYDYATDDKKYYYKKKINDVFL